MRRIQIAVTGQLGKQSFLVNLHIKSLFSLEGKWKCQPGYLRKSEGYFNKGIFSNDLILWEHEPSLFDSWKSVAANMFVVIEKISSSPQIGDKGVCYVHAFGNRKLVKNSFGVAVTDSVCDWEVKEAV